ncbi:uncharacterized protein LOC106072216 [Biomphalaria glabrata]|uniref:Uncharacterized protein LOC106072216 n=1 Tax=Biomphalaria glabrata TaxID=6526 RepID=A0A9W3BMC9_BIOGL|nr:uncharacterized protein LOC106072216 [Biomphalaria glabrata]
MTRQSITFRQLWQLASRFAHVLKSAGVRQGEYVLVTTPLSIEFWVASLGVILTGAVHISTEKFYSGGEIITEVVNMSKARYIVLSGDQGSEMWDMFKNDAKPVAGSTFVTSVCCRSMPTLEKLVLTNKSSESKGANFLEVLASLSEEFCNPDIQPEDGAAVVLSIDKDKANRPKMCEISHAAIAAYSKVFWKKFPDVFKNYLYLPWYIVAALPFDTLSGVTRVLPDCYRTEPQAIFELSLKIKDAEQMNLMIVPAQFILYVMERRKHLPGPYVEFVYTGGQPFTSTIVKKCEGFAKKMYIGYAGSEILGATLLEIQDFNLYDDYDAGCLLPDVQIQIVDDSMKEVPRGQTGRVLVKSPTLCKGYVGDPLKTKSAFTQDGWLCIDDLGQIREDGRILIFGRGGDVISRGIVLIYPVWIEEPLLAHQDIVEVKAVPVPDSLNVNNVCACVVKRPKSTLSEEDVKEIVNTILTPGGSDYITIDHVLFFEKELPNVRRLELSQLAAKMLGKC